jgi:hypothetical protein
MSEIMPRQNLAAWSVGQADAVLAHHLLVILVDAGADRLDELEPFGLRHQIVSPHHRRHHHVGLRDPCGVFVGLPDLEVGNAGAAGRKAGGHLVSAVGEADVELVFAGQHVEPSCRDRGSSSHFAAAVKPTRPTR